MQLTDDESGFAIEIHIHFWKQWVHGMNTQRPSILLAEMLAVVDRTGVAS